MKPFLIRLFLRNFDNQLTRNLFIGLIPLLAALLLLGSCASSGPKFITLAYTQTPAVSSTGELALSRFVDQRGLETAAEIGYRELNDKTREIFLVKGTDLAQVLSEQTRIYLERKGLKVYPGPSWTPDLNGLAAADAPVDTLLTARINTFDLQAKKTGAITKMVLDLNLTFFLGNKTDKELKTIPVALTLERTEINFTLEKVEKFYNQTLAEVLEKALPFD